MRSQIFLAAALLSSAVFAQRVMPNSATTPQPSTGKEMNLGNGVLKAPEQMPNSSSVLCDGSMIEPVAIVLQRDLRECIQGNLDRESIERSNGETR